MGIVSQQEQKQDAKETSSSITTAQQECSRDGAETSRNAELVQRRNNRKVQEEGKKNLRNAEGTSNSAGASEQKRRKPHQEHSRN